jgi:antirestriction protein ArdC
MMKVKPKTMVNTKEKVKEAYALIEQGIKSITSSEQYKEFLKFSASFYNYSLNNQLLIWAQKPTATYVAGFNAWKKLGRSVKKGEKGIQILAPLRIKATRFNDDIEEEETKEFNRYRVTYVFDVSQTEGEAIPNIHEFVKTVDGETELYEMVKNISPFPVSELADCEGADGYYNLITKEIKISSKNPTSHRLLTLIHEIAHGLLHGDRKTSPNKTIREVEAESVGFIVCHALGIDTSANSLGYLASYGGRSTMQLVKDNKERINTAAKKILASFETAYVNNDTEAVEISL